MNEIRATTSRVRFVVSVGGVAGIAVVLSLGLIAGSLDRPIGALLTVASIAFCCEFIDSSLGMGYGTTFTPILLLMGYELTAAVPAVPISELLTGLTAGGFHHMLGNAHFGLRSRDTAIAMTLATSGIVGAVVAVNLLTHVPSYWAKLYFALMIISVGLIITLRSKDTYGFSWRKVVGLGLSSSFNKGISGGGYGPLVVGGQVLAGCDAKNAVACTSISESVVCFVALISFAAVGVFPPAELTIPIVMGAVVSAPCATVMTHYLDRKADLKRLVGIIVLLLGIVCLIKVLGLGA